MLVLVLSFAVTRGPLAPVQVTAAEVKHVAVKFSVFGIGTVEARLAYSIGPPRLAAF